MCMFNVKGDKSVNEYIYFIGIFVYVVDFDLMDDGLFGIKVVGFYFVEVLNIILELDGF